MLAPSEVCVYPSLSAERSEYRMLIRMIVHCSMLAEDAIKSAISNYYTKNPKAKATDLGGTAAEMPKIEVDKVMETPAQQPAMA